MPARWASWGPGPHWQWAWGQEKGLCESLGRLGGVACQSQQTVAEGLLRRAATTAGGPGPRERAGAMRVT